MCKVFLACANHERSVDKRLDSAIKRLDSWLLSCRASEREMWGCFIQKRTHNHPTYVVMCRDSSLIAKLLKFMIAELYVPRALL